MPLLETKGAGSAQGFGLSLGSAEAVYIEDVFSTYLYTGNGSTQTITNGIDLAGKGGLVWAKTRDFSSNHALFDTVRGGSSLLQSNLTNAVYTGDTYISPFSSNGFTWAFGDNQINGSGRNYASWTFRKQPKFFDIVTYTGTGVAGRTVAHNLGSVPGCIIVKRLNDLENWDVYHRSVGATGELRLNQTAGTSTDIQFWNNTEPTSTVFTVGTNSGINASGGTYVAYLFAHNAGGFGLTGLDNVISCGSFTTDGSGVASVSLGYEPQWVMTKNSSGSSAWRMFDTMRGMTVADINDALLQAQSSSEEIINSDYCSPNATGFAINGHEGSATFIYIAIRRGPMEVPTSGTEVFKPISRTGTGANATIASGFTTDLQIVKSTSQPYNNAWFDRLRGTGIALFSDSTVADQNYGAVLNFQSNTAVNISSETLINQSGQTFANFSLRRAPGFFDVVCLNSTTSAAQVLSHNLGVAPEIIISKRRNGVSPWQTFDATNYLRLNTDQADIGVPQYNTFTSTTFSINAGACSSGENWVFYLFATLAGVSKVGSYTGTGTTLQINCGFTGGARFVMIKRTDSTGDWYVWDSARGIIAGNDPYLLLNSTAAEVTSTDYVDTYSAGFEISSTAPAAINASAGTFIFLAIA